ncbi:MAG: hypothetical protein PHN44_00100 [Candidatus Marinimicrobia bacterium]|nr:hypothetical protein [Candidatus Neomarinimicrobiota bacterium]
MAPTDTIPQPKKRKYFGDPEEKSSLFSGFETGIKEDDNSVGSLVNKNLTGMLTGSSYDASRTKQREGLQRAAQNLRAQSGQTNAAALGQGIARKAQGGVERTIFQGLADTEMGMDVEEQAMKERGINQALEIGKAEQGLAVEREQIGAQKEIAQMNIASSEKIAANALNFDQAKLAESARQFNISTEQANSQFSQSLNKEYAELSQADRQFLATLGLDEAKFNESKAQFQQTLEQQGRLTMAQLGVEEKRILEEARQFDSRLKFDNSELAANLSEAEKNRVWQALQNDKAAAATKEIATMQNDTERWKTDQMSILTKAGWTEEAAQKQLDRTLQITLLDKANALQREIEKGRITQTEADRAQQASQFAEELAWNKEAMQIGITADEAARAWETNERLSKQVYAAGEADLDRQLNREIESGRINIAERELVQNAANFRDQLEFNKSELAANLSEADKNRIWQSSESAKDRIQEANLQQLQNEFTAQGWNFQALMTSLDYLPEEQVADTLKSAAVKAGITYTATNPDGTVQTDDEGNSIQIPGFKSYVKEFTSKENADVVNRLIQGVKLSETDIPKLDGLLENLVKQGRAITDNGVESMSIAQWKTDSGKNRWIITDTAKQWVADNAGKLYKASNGRYYRVSGTSEPTDRGTSGGIIFEDVLTGGKVKITRGSSFPGSEA